MPSAERSVCVMIAAYNAEATIARAVTSALKEPEVTEVVVVDDCSHDRTIDAALSANDGTGRISILKSPENRGPAAARNQALAASTAPYVAILDSDDFFVPGRFGRLLADDDWDMVADNIIFIAPDLVDTFGAVGEFEARPQFLGLAAFVEGNISKRGLHRGEIGFLKPVISRSFLEDHGLRYAETLRLGEDYDLYTRALACGARYKVVRTCGYVAIERPDSLSAKHRTDDLRCLLNADRALLENSALDTESRTALLRHARQTRRKYEHRRFLDRKRDTGFAAACLLAFSRPASVPAIAGAILRDKIDVQKRNADNAKGTRRTPAVRYLFPDGMSTE